MRERFKGLEPVENKELEKELWSKKRDLRLKSSKRSGIIEP